MRVKPTMKFMETTAPVSTDFHQWAFDTAEAIRERRFEEIDWNRVAEELKDLGISQENALESHLAQLMYHLLKIQYPPERHSRSWDITVNAQRQAIHRLLLKQPSLKACLENEEFLQSAYEQGTAESAKDDLPDSVTVRFPDRCPYSVGVLLPGNPTNSEAEH